MSAIKGTVRFVDIEPFIGSEALASGVVRKHQLRARYATVFPGVYLPRGVTPSLRQRISAAWLWSQRAGTVAGAAASAMHGSRWIDRDIPVDVIAPRGRAPAGIVVRQDLLLHGETTTVERLPVTTPVRTAFDLGRRGPLTRAVARLDALTRATHLDTAMVAELASSHPHTRGLRQLEKALDLVDAGAESPQETWLRLLLIHHGFPRPETQILVCSPGGRRRYYLDMGWRETRLAVEYDGDHHRTSKDRFAYEIRRAEDIAEVGWKVIRVAARSREADVLGRVSRAWRTAQC